MNITNHIMEMARDNNGTITTSMVVSAGYSRGNLKYLVDKGILERAARGVYVLPDAWEDEMLILQNRFKRGVFSHETALFLADLTDRTPNMYCMTFPTTYNLTNPKEERIDCAQCCDYLYELGIVEMTTPAGNMVKAYNAERTLCDLLRAHRGTDIQVIAEAFKRYTTRRDKNIPLLSDYARKLRVEKRLRAYLEVLL